ncbi:MAG: tellurite resistance TerB family protein [Polyangiales bacterium]
MAFSVKGAFEQARWDESDEEQPWAVAELALWAATSDDEIEDHEVRTIVQTLRSVPGLTDFTEEDAQEIVDEMESFATEEAVQARIAELAGAITDATLRRVTWQLAAYCAASDGELSAEEEDFLEYLQDAFDIDDEEAEALFHEATG